MHLGVVRSVASFCTNGDNGCNHMPLIIAWHISLLPDFIHQEAERKRKREKQQQCAICCNDQALDAFPVLHEGASHPANICSNCISRHMRQEITGKAGAHVLCPADGCGTQLPRADLSRLGAPSELLERLDSNQLKQWIQSQPNFRWCAHAGCGGGCLHEAGADAPKMGCQDCGRSTCYTHRVPWHEGQTFEEYNRAAAEQQQSQQDADREWISKHAKLGPRCGMAIQKSQVCAHITCRAGSGGCGHEFCWACLADWWGPTSQHLQTCNYCAH